MFLQDTPKRVVLLLDCPTYNTKSTKHQRQRYKELGREEALLLKRATVPYVPSNSRQR